jgi:hypothetical protein
MENGKKSHQIAFYCSCQEVIRQSSDSCQTAIRQLSGNFSEVYVQNFTLRLIPIVFTNDFEATFRDVRHCARTWKINMAI